MSGKLRGEIVRRQSTRPFTLRVIVYDAFLADTDNTVVGQNFNLTKFIFPQKYEIAVPNEILDDNYRYAISVSVRDPRNKNQLVWLTTTATFIESNRTTYDLDLVKIGI